MNSMGEVTRAENELRASLGVLNDLLPKIIEALDTARRKADEIDGMAAAVGIDRTVILEEAERNIKAARDRMGEMLKSVEAKPVVAAKRTARKAKD